MQVFRCHLSALHLIFVDMVCIHCNVQEWIIGQQLLNQFLVVTFIFQINFNEIFHGLVFDTAGEELRVFKDYLIKHNNTYLI